MAAKPFISLIIALGLSFGTASCQGCAESQGCAELAVITAPVWIPIALISKVADQNKAREKAEQASAVEASKAREKAEQARTAAEGGDPKAQYDLGDYYWTGLGVPQNDAEAVKWYRRSAEEGYADAQISLALAYQVGRGVAQDNLQADTWYIIAASSQTSSAVDRSILSRDRAYIEANMTPEQIAEAQKRAREWKPAETGSKS